MYWLLAILDEVQEGNVEIEFRKLITRMIAYAWYPISKFRLYFGACDNLGKVVNYISDTYNLKPNINKSELIDFIYNSPTAFHAVSTSKELLDANDTF